MPEFLQQNFYIALIAYALICGVITSVAQKRGWESMGVFLVCVICTPLVAAILYAPYKDEDYLAKMEKERQLAKERVNG